MLSELDANHQHLLATWLLSLDGQIFVTGVDEKRLLEIWDKVDVDTAMFHVKHGSVAKIC